MEIGGTVQQVHELWLILCHHNESRNDAIKLIKQESKKIKSPSTWIDDLFKQMDPMALYRLYNGFIKIKKRNKF